MPGWEYDNRIGQMVPKKKKGLEFHAVNGGLKVIDNDLSTSFIILRRTDEISYMQGLVATRGVKLWDYKKAMEIANRVKRVLPASKYTDYKLFCRSVRENQMSNEDYALLETLVNGYGDKSLCEAVNEIHNNSLNEVGHAFSSIDIESSDERTIGKEKHGLKGLAYAIPSAIVSFMICPPLALIGLIGAIRVRSEKSWLSGKASFFNTKTWLDYIATKNPQKEKEKIKEKVKEAFAKNTKYYYTELYNGEIIKVPAATTVEARDMIVAIQRADIEKRYAHYNETICHKSEDGQNFEVGLINPDTKMFYSNLYSSSGEPILMWCIKFSDGQVCYGFGEEGQKDEVRKQAEESRKAVVEYYKKVILNDDDYDKKKKIEHKGIGKEYRKEDIESDVIDESFVPPHVDDMIEIKNIGLYSPLYKEVDKKFSDPTTSAPAWRPKNVPKFLIPVNDLSDQHNEILRLNLYANSSDEAGAIFGYVIMGALKNIAEKQKNTITACEQIERTGNQFNNYINTVNAGNNPSSSSTSNTNPQNASNNTNYRQAESVNEDQLTNNRNYNNIATAERLCVKITTCGCSFNLTVLDDRKLRNDGSRDSNSIEPSIRNRYNNSQNFHFYSSIKEIFGEIKNALKKAYIESNTGVSKEAIKRFDNIFDTPYGLDCLDNNSSADWSRIINMVSNPCPENNLIEDCKIIVGENDNLNSQATTVLVKIP